MAKTLLGNADFSHVPGKADYMDTTVQVVNQLGEHLEVLDVPAGNGYVVDQLNALGHKAIGGDINDERDNYVVVDMEKRFPFEDCSLDAVTCLEGIEHVLDGYHVLSEMSRVVKPGGLIVISTPNTMNLYSRLWYFLYGYPYQFPPCSSQHLKDKPIDRGHINPISYLRIRFLIESLGLEVLELHGDRKKKKHLTPFLFPVFLFGWMLGYKHRKKDQIDEAERMFSISQDLKSPALLFSRSIIVVAKKPI